MNRSTVSRRRSESSSLTGRNRSSGGSHATTDRVIMLRFRPIAPKPVTGIDTTAVRSDNVSEIKNSVITSKRRPAKRKYEKTQIRSSAPAKNKKEDQDSPRNYFSDQINRQLAAGESPSTPTILFNSRNKVDAKTTPSYFQKFLLTGSSTGGGSDLRPPEPCFRYPEIYDVVVETVVNNISNGGEIDALELGRTDMEKMRMLAGDTLPGFISDSSNKVIWVNGAFTAMIRGVGREETATVDSAPDMVVEDRQAELRPETRRAFSCHVKLRRRGKVRCGGGSPEEKYGVIPCDVWGMDLGGFAWRLDVKTALTLGCCYYQSIP